MIGASNSATEKSPLQSASVQMRTGGGLGSFWRKVRAITNKELRTELRAKEVLATMIIFSILAVIVMGLAFDALGPESATIVTAGVVWSTLLFSGILGLNRSFGAEVDRGSLPALLLAPMDRNAIYFGKLLANLIFTLLTQVTVLPFVLVMFDVNLFKPWILLGLLLGVFGYVSVGTFFAALAANSRARETLLPVLLLPVLVPLFIAGVSLTTQVTAGRGFDQIGRWLGMLAIFDAIFLVIPYMLFDLIWEDG